MLRNEAIIAVSLGRGYGAFLIVQEKFEPAWIEAQLLDKKTVRPSTDELSLIVVSGGLAYGVVICSDLTNIQHRVRFQGFVDAMFAVEWNQDINSFSSIIESSSLDIHAYMIQCNNRHYGDSRIRGPMKVSHQRDIVQVRGGVEDYFVFGEINSHKLRKYQSKYPPALKECDFKPYPIGFKKADYRRPDSDELESSP